MSHLFMKLWKDDAGIVALEYLLVATIVGLGLIVGLAALEASLNAELTELGNAIGALSQAYSISTQSNCKASKQGSATTDTPETIGFSFGAVSATAIDVSVCP